MAHCDAFALYSKFCSRELCSILFSVQGGNLQLCFNRVASIRTAPPLHLRSTNVPGGPEQLQSATLRVQKTQKRFGSSRDFVISARDAPRSRPFAVVPELAARRTPGTYLSERPGGRSRQPAPHSPAAPPSRHGLCFYSCSASKYNSEPSTRPPPFALRFAAVRDPARRVTPPTPPARRSTGQRPQVTAPRAPTPPGPPERSRVRRGGRARRVTSPPRSPPESSGPVPSRGHPRPGAADSIRVPNRNGGRRRRGIRGPAMTRPGPVRVRAGRGGRR